MEKITVVHIITGLGLGGAERMLSNLVTSMDRNRFENVIISLKDMGYWGAILQQQGITVHTLNMQPSVFSILKLYKLYSLLRKYRPHCVQAWMYHANIVALLVGKAAGVRNIYWNIRCSVTEISNYRFTTTLMFKGGGLLAKYPQRVINNSRESIRDHGANGYCKAKWLYIPNGFDTQSFVPNQAVRTSFLQQHELPTDAVIIGIIARYDPMKDHATFLKAAAILAKNNPKVYFVCAGRGLNKHNIEISNLLEANILQDRVLLLDEVSNVQQLLPVLDYLTQTSIGEGFPNVVAEAMSCGIECFVTDVGESVEIIGSTGFKIPLRDPAAVAQAWSNAIARDAKQITDGRDAARQRIVDYYGLQKISEIYSDCYVRNA